MTKGNEKINSVCGYKGKTNMFVSLKCNPILRVKCFALPLTVSEGYQLACNTMERILEEGVTTRCDWGQLSFG